MTERSEAEVGIRGFVVAGGDTTPVLQLVEQSFDRVAPAIFFTVMRCRVAAVAPGWDDRFDVYRLDLFADRIGIVAAIGEEDLDPIVS